MNDVIQLLPDSVANQIAAGEVIQRPASVIKELVENSVDAGARNIHVIIVDAGRTRIQVIDDGKGMSETDARLSFERHATSKIRQANDLFALHTMGFRGEALASIAAVAQVELKTRMAEEEIGTAITISGSRVVSQEPCSCQVGSSFSVNNLFYNVPARRKFLKSNTTELNNILTSFERIVLVYPEISFTLHSNGTEMMNLKAGNIRQRIIEVFGKRLNQDLLSVNTETTLCKLYGFVGKPESAKKRGVHQYFFVNGRYMKHPYFHKAVMTAFDRLIPQEMQVPYFLYFDVNPEDIDVNIHPTKTEIKFENEQAIWQILMAAVKEAIGMFNDVPSIDFDVEDKPEIPIFSGGSLSNPSAPKITLNPQYNPFKSTASHTSKTSSIDSNWQELYAGLEDKTSQGEEHLFTPAANESNAEISLEHYQYKGKYIMTAVKSGLMIVDQHRAHVRILFSQYLNLLHHHSFIAQKVMFPEVVQFPISDKVVADKILPELSMMGFELDDLGAGSYAVNATPAGLDGINPVALVQDMVASATESGKSSSDEIERELALTMARNAAIPYGQVLNNMEMDKLVNDLFACDNVNYTPDGKKILTIFEQQDIDSLLM